MQHTNKRDGWYRRKGYAHFDNPLGFEVASAYVEDPENVAKHSFLPFLSYALERRRINKRPKSRPIKYASHRDGYIFAYYAQQLAEKYENLVVNNGLGTVVLAYRKGRGNNISFAKESFQQITNLRNCVALGFDIASFFDKIDHLELKKQWAFVLGVNRLPADHYAVFRSLSRYSFISREACYDALGYSASRREKGGRICTIQEFRMILKDQNSLIQINTLPYGIPQGSALSAVLANIYLYPFDLEMNKLAEQIGGIYRRYCDDILFIAKLDDEQFVRDTVRKKLAIAGSQLQVQDDKTVTSHFVENVNNKIVLRDDDAPFQYLGFTFDGERILLRSQTLSRFWRKVVVATRKANRDATRASEKGRDGRIFKRKLYRRFSHLGRSNFLTYAKRASDHFDSNNYKRAASWKQVKSHWKKLEKLIAG